MYATPSSVSCGVVQIYSLLPTHNYPPGTKAAARLSLLESLLSTLATTSTQLCGTVVFSDADCYGNGIRLASEIKEAFGEEGLVSVSNKNPNSGNRIRTWLWSPNWHAVLPYYEKSLAEGRIMIPLARLQLASKYQSPTEQRT